MWMPSLSKMPTNPSIHAQSETRAVHEHGRQFHQHVNVERGISRVVRDVFISGTLSPKRSTAFQCDVKTPEQKNSPMAWRRTQPTPKPTGDEVLMPIARDLVTEVQRSIDFYLSKGQTARSPNFLMRGQRESGIPHTPYRMN